VVVFDFLELQNKQKIAFVWTDVGNFYGPEMFVMEPCGVPEKFEAVEGAWKVNWHQVHAAISRVSATRSLMKLSTGGEC
jgi:hypothetical protein